jgi:hypothetical protein
MSASASPACRRAQDILIARDAIGFANAFLSVTVSLIFSANTRYVPAAASDTCRASSVCPSVETSA